MITYDDVYSILDPYITAEFQDYLADYDCFSKDATTSFQNFSSEILFDDITSPSIPLPQENFLTYPHAFSVWATHVDQDDSDVFSNAFNVTLIPSIHENKKIFILIHLDNTELNIELYKENQIKELKESLKSAAKYFLSSDFPLHHKLDLLPQIMCFSDITVQDFYADNDQINAMKNLALLAKHSEQSSFDYFRDAAAESFISNGKTVLMRSAGGNQSLRKLSDIEAIMFNTLLIGTPYANTEAVRQISLQELQPTSVTFIPPTSQPAPKV